MLRVCFDEEVDSELIESFRKSLQRLRWPQSVFGTFAFVSGARSHVSRTLSQRHQSIKKSQKSLTNAANLARQKVTQNKISLRRTKNDVDEDKGKRRNRNDEEKDSNDAESEEEVFDGENRTKRDNALGKTEKLIQNFNVLGENSLCIDYERAGLCSVTKIVIGSPWRLSMANLNYNICRGFVVYLMVVLAISHLRCIKFRGVLRFART